MSWHRSYKLTDRKPAEEAKADEPKADAKEEAKAE